MRLKSIANADFSLRILEHDVPGGTTITVIPKFSEHSQIWWRTRMNRTDLLERIAEPRVRRNT